MRIEHLPKPMQEVAAVTAMYLHDGIEAYCTGQPRDALPDWMRRSRYPLWAQLWRSGWDHAQAMDAQGDQYAADAARSDPQTLTEARAELDRAKILAWRDRHTLTAIDGQQAPTQRLVRAAPDVSL